MSVHIASDNRYLQLCIYLAVEPNEELLCVYVNNI